MKTNASIFANRGNPWDREPRLPSPDKPPPLEGFERASRVIANRAAILLDRPTDTRGLRAEKLTLELDDPEMDCFTKARKARVREALAPEKGRPARSQGLAQRLLNIKLQTNRLMLGAKPAKVDDPPPSPQPLNLASTGQSNKGSKQSGFSIWAKRDTGEEIEVDRPTYRIAATSFRRAKARKDTVAVELWSYDTGELLMSYKARGR